MKILCIFATLLLCAATLLQITAAEPTSADGKGPCRAHYANHVFRIRVAKPLEEEGNTEKENSPALDSVTHHHQHRKKRMAFHNTCAATLVDNHGLLITAHHCIKAVEPGDMVFASSKTATSDTMDEWSYGVDTQWPDGTEHGHWLNYQDSSRDLAFLKITKSVVLAGSTTNFKVLQAKEQAPVFPPRITPATIGDSHLIQPTDPVCLVGFPISHSVILSDQSLASIQSMNGAERGNFVLNGVQDGGMSGGAVFDSNGRLIAVTRATHGNSQTFAVPINLARQMWCKAAHQQPNGLGSKTSKHLVVKPHDSKVLLMRPLQKQPIDVDLTELVETQKNHNVRVTLRTKKALAPSFMSLTAKIASLPRKQFVDEWHDADRRWTLNFSPCDLVGAEKIEVSIENWYTKDCTTATPVEDMAPIEVLLRVEAFDTALPLDGSFLHNVVTPTHNIYYTLRQDVVERVAPGSSVLVKTSFQEQVRIFTSHTRHCLTEANPDLDGLNALLPTQEVPDEEEHVYAVDLSESLTEMRELNISVPSLWVIGVHGLDSYRDIPFNISFFPPMELPLPTSGGGGNDEL